MENQFQDLEYIVGFHTEVHIKKYQGAYIAGTNSHLASFASCLVAEAYTTFRKAQPPSEVVL